MDIGTTNYVQPCEHGNLVAAPFGCSLCDMHAKFRAEHKVMAEVLADLDHAIRWPMGPTPMDVAFVWSQSQERVLSGMTTWQQEFPRGRSARSPR